ncbi:MAG: rhomboid family intramembrane serine protease [Gemmatimonadetes bacterium]|nr:rhomboid family intramembrane serine protease [Gemmatimonadota bacterium]
MAYRTDGFGFGGFMLTAVVKRLLFANVAAFLLVWALPRGFASDWLVFRPDHVLARPWGMFTYMFVHQGIMHLLGNMLVLFFFGPPLESRWGGREFFQYYVVCGLGGVLLSFLLAPSGIAGASAAAYGLMLAFAMSWPDAPIYVWGIFPVQAKWLMAGLFVITVVSAFGGGGDGIAHMAHLGGLVTGFVYLKAGWRPSEKLAAFKQRSARAARRLAIVPRDEDTQTAAAARTGTWRTAGEGELLDAVDRVLDKISADGMSALTADERGLLDEVSRRHRTAK